MKQIALRPHDVPVALQLALEPDTSFPILSRTVGLSVGEVHNAVGRLNKARLLMPGARRVVLPSLLEFAVHGVPYAFPAEPGPETMGVPTAHSAPPLAEHYPTDEHYVWPAVDGTLRGHSVTPLLPSAPHLPSSNPLLYRLLALLDAVRLGRARERKEAANLLENAIRPREIWR